ncbi:MAG: metallophosphoesterase [Pseudomonadota bacterium]
MSSDQPKQDPLFTFAIISDTHIRPKKLDESSPFPVNDLANDRARFAIAAIEHHQPPLVLHLGDMVHPLPHLPTFLDACEQAHEIFAPLRDRMQFMPGNHDIGDKPNPDAPAGPADDETIAQYEGQFGKSYHSFEHGDCVFIMINSSLVNSGAKQENEQKEWLQQTLETNRGRRIFLCSHYPAFIYEPGEQSHYDNFAEPGRTWFLDLVREYNIEAVFSGHVHQFFYNRIGKSRLYCLPATSFIRQDYAELYAIDPPKEYGRNDEGKFGVTLIDVLPEGHRVRVIPTDGQGLAAGTALDPRQLPWSANPATNLIVPLRHAWATPIDLPYNGPMEEFARKRTRNDYVLMRLQQMGIKHVRVPLSDLLDDQIRARMVEFNSTGVRFALFALGVPTAAELDLIEANRSLVSQLEIIGATDDLSDLSSDLPHLRAIEGLKLLIGKSHSSKHEPKQGSRFAHSVSSGFKWETRDTVMSALRASDNSGLISGFIIQLNLVDELQQRLAGIESFAVSNNLKIDVNLRLANANPAIANYDDSLIANRVQEAARLAQTLTATAVQIDTFVDVDRGYNPRHGLLDRHYNFRLAGRSLATSQ